MTDTPLLRTNAALLFERFHLENMAHFEHTMWFAVTSFPRPTEEFKGLSPLIEEMRAMNRASAALGCVTLGLTHSAFASVCAIAVALMSMPTFKLVIGAERVNGERVDLIEPLYRILRHSFRNHDLFSNYDVVEQPRRVGRIFQDGHPDFPLVRHELMRMTFVLDDQPKERSML